MAYLRSRAYAVLGLVHALAAAPSDAFAGARGPGQVGRAALPGLHGRRGPGWEWCEDRLTYDNARLPEALLRAGSALGHPPYREAGLSMLEFYAKVTLENGVFVPVGNAGWFVRGGEKSRSGQQPLEAAAMVAAALAAHALTGETTGAWWPSWPTPGSWATTPTRR